MSTASAWPDHLLSLSEWEALDEDHARRVELVEGVLLVVPRPSLAHQWAGARLVSELERQLPDRWTAVPDVEVVLNSRYPATVRAPDLVVVEFAVVERNPARVVAADALLVVEIVSPGTVRTDRVTKPAEYADAGIPHFWRVELGPPVSLAAYTLTAGEYHEVFSGSGVATLDVPVPLRLDLDALTRRR